jgi:DNA-binding GntR family transcriptional regulator
MAQNSGMPQNTRLKKPGSLRERIYADLRVRLQRCEFGPDDRLVDVDVAATYGTSRMPVREALLQLVNDGYLVGTTRGFAIPTLMLEDIREIFEVRKLLEPRAAAHAARDLDHKAEKALTKAIGEARAAVEAGEVERLIMANIDFRTGWLACVHNKRLATTIGRFVDHVQTVRLETLRRTPTRQVVIDGLEDLYAAFMDRDPINASDRMAAFIGAAEQAFFAARKDAEFPIVVHEPTATLSHLRAVAG